MNAQLLEYARIELSRALIDAPRTAKGQLEAFRERPPADKSRYHRQGSNTVQLDGGREVLAERSPTHAPAARVHRQSVAMIKEQEYSSSSWRRAVLTLERHQIAWLSYCYGHDLAYEHQITICEHVWNNYQRQLVGQRIQKRVKVRLASLVWLAVQNVAAENHNTGLREYAGAVLSRLLSVSRSTWGVVYAPHWLNLKALAQELDAVALRGVLNRVGALS